MPLGPMRVIEEVKPVVPIAHEPVCVPDWVRAVGPHLQGGQGGVGEYGCIVSMRGCAEARKGRSQRNNRIEAMGKGGAQNQTES